MHYQTFIIYNIVGGALWSLTLTYSGFYLGRAFPGLQNYVEYAVIGIVLLSLLPGLIHFLKNENNRKRIKNLPKVTTAKIKQLVRRQ